MNVHGKCIYAIDFGTTNSLIAAVWKDHFELLNIDPKNSDPTIIRTLIFTPTRGEWSVGREAIDAYYENDGEGRFFRSVKKFLPDPNFSGTSVHERFMGLEEIIAVFLRHLKERADLITGLDVKQVVLGRPAAFDLVVDNDVIAENRLRKAAYLAGFEDVSFCAEPLAAAYDFQNELTEEKKVLVADFGGGTSDFTVLTMGPNDFTRDNVLAMNGIFIAGDVFDGRIMRNSISKHFGANVYYKLPMGTNDISFPKALLEKLCTPAYIPHLRDNDIRIFLEDIKRFSLTDEDKQKMNQLFELIDCQLGYDIFAKIERAKVELSNLSETNFEYHRYDIAIEEKILRSAFEEYSSTQVAAIMERLDRCLIVAKLTPAEIDVVCVTGGSAKLPILSKELIERFGKEKLSDYKNFHSIILGLAKFAQKSFLR